GRASPCWVYISRSLIVTLDQHCCLFRCLCVSDSIDLSLRHTSRFRVFHLPIKELDSLLRRSVLRMNPRNSLEVLYSVGSVLEVTKGSATVSHSRRIKPALVLYVSKDTRSHFWAIP